jgi:hypothetical protein
VSFDIDTRACPARLQAGAPGKIARLTPAETAS